MKAAASTRRDASPVLLLSRADVAALLSFEDCVGAVEAALLDHASGRALVSAVASVPVFSPAGGGAFHVKAGGLASSFVAKVNANFPGNPERRGLPTVQGLIVLSDPECGRPLAVMDSIEITIRRTGAATAIAARWLARPDSRTGIVSGCGVQGAIQAEALAHALPLERLWLHDADAARAASLATALTARLGVAATAIAPGDLREAVRGSDACVTCTTSRSPVLGAGDLRPGSFLAAVGADSPDKQELEAALLASSRVVVDDLDQCAELGELHHALEAGAMSRQDVVSDLAAVVSGKAPGRRDDRETFIFDSTGIALEDAAAAAIVYRRAVETGRGVSWAV